MSDALKPKFEEDLNKFTQVKKDFCNSYRGSSTDSKHHVKNELNNKNIAKMLPCLSNEADSSSRIMRVEEAFSDREKLMKNLLDKSFVEKHRRGTLKQIQKEKRADLQEGNVIRKRADRELMHGAECSCCMDYYNALDLSPNSKVKRINQVSRHRYVENPMPKTPEHYWEVGFPSESEQRSRGLIKIATPRKMKDSISKKLF